MKHRLLPLFGFAAASLLAGCTTPDQPAASAGKPKAARQEQYVEVNSVGSWIPRKVKKPADLAGSNTTTLAGEALDQVTAAGASRTVKESQLGGPVTER